jgi:Ni,Fe-hydrogenase maturation factor
MTKVIKKFYLYFSPFVLFYLFTFGSHLSGQGNKNYYDGPYIDNIGDSLKIQWVEAGLPHDSTILKSTATIFNISGLPVVDLSKLDIIEEDNWEFDNVKKFIVVSDIHGKYETMISLLNAHNVIDSLGNWSFGENHLVIAGDHFDRGDKVMEILWFLFKLEKQALEAGGKVHVLLGNHEVMIINNDLRYLNVKYAYTSGALQRRYFEFFTSKSVLGDWLRKKNILVTINDNLIVHGGLSQRMVDANISGQDINRYFRDSILVNSAKNMSESPIIALLTGDEGPLWYRGYADTLSYHEDSLNNVLNFYNVNSIIVGHTIMPSITPRFGDKLFLIDCGLVSGNKGEVLIWKDDQFYRGKSNGKKSEFIKTVKKEKRSLFETIYNLETNKGNPKLILTTNLKNLINNKMKEEEQESSLSFLTATDSTIISANPKVRARGNMRKQVCYFPPVKFNFAKKDLSKFGFKSADKLKMVLPCRGGKSNQEKLYQEYFLYTLYQIIDSLGVRSKLVDIQILNEKNEKEEEYTGFIVEDEDSYALRTDAKIVDSRARLNSTVLERKPFLLMYFFQYMIANTDWSVGNRHNVIIAKLPQYTRVVALPYDYDYSGFVGQSYAVPAESLPIKNVNERYFMPYVISDEEFDFAVKYFQDYKQKLMAVCDGATYLDEKRRENNKKFLSGFFDELDRPDRLRNNIKTKE